MGRLSCRTYEQVQQQDWRYLSNLTSLCDAPIYRHFVEQWVGSSQIELAGGQTVTQDELFPYRLWQIMEHVRTVYLYPRWIAENNLAEPEWPSRPTIVPCVQGLHEVCDLCLAPGAANMQLRRLVFVSTESQDMHKAIGHLCENRALSTIPSRCCSRFRGWQLARRFQRPGVALQQLGYPSDGASCHGRRLRW